MNYPRTRNAVGLLTAAAAIIFAVTVLVGAWDGVAFADVVDQLRQIDTISCRIVSTTVTADERLTATGTMKISSKFGTRCDFDVNGGTAATLIKPVDEPAIVVTPSVKSYMVVEGADDDDGFDTMREPDAFLKKLTELTDSASESLGRSQIDGFNVVGFEIAPEQLELGLADAKAELFVDEETSLPVLFKLELAGPNPRTHVEVTYDQFEWNQPAPAELFELEIGDDYTEINVRVPAVDEAAFIEGMRVYAEVLDGRYPAELDLMPIITEVLQASANRAVADGKDVAHDSDEQGALRQQAMVLGAAVRFYGRLVSQGTKPEYFGDEVTADDVDSVLLQWRVDDRHVRIIYADLSAETVADSE